MSVVLASYLAAIWSVEIVFAFYNNILFSFEKQLSYIASYILTFIGWTFTNLLQFTKIILPANFCILRYYSTKVFLQLMCSVYVYKMYKKFEFEKGSRNRNKK